MAASEVLRIQSLLHELQISIPTPAIYRDNQSTIPLSQSCSALHNKTYGAAGHFLCEKALNKSLAVTYVPAQVANFLTKP